MRYAAMTLIVLAVGACNRGPAAPPARSTTEAVHAPRQELSAMAGLIGLWQEEPVVASGWMDTFRFFRDGRFEFNRNQMLCDQRDISYGGRFRTAGRTITLTITHRVRLAGGHLGPAYGSCASDSELDGAHPESLKVSPPTIRALRFSSPDTAQIDRKKIRLTGSEWLWRIKVGGREYWKMDNDPTAHE